MLKLNLWNGSLGDGEFEGVVDITSSPSSHKSQTTTWGVGEGGGASTNALSCSVSASKASISWQEGACPFCLFVFWATVFFTCCASALLPLLWGTGAFVSYPRGGRSFTNRRPSTWCSLSCFTEIGKMLQLIHESQRASLRWPTTRH